MTKEVHLPQIGRVVLTKRRASRHIRLRVNHDGVAHVSLPYWVTYHQALTFIATKQRWIEEQQSKRTAPTFVDSQRLGKAHVLRFAQSGSYKTHTKIVDNEAIVYVAPGADASAAVKRVTLRVLKIESESLLIQRLQVLARQHGFHYSEAKIGTMRSRWGSCNSNKLIMLSCYLIQLPWELIDYVLLHELVHTEIMAHDERFWTRLKQVEPNVQGKRKQLKAYHPQILTPL